MEIENKTADKEWEDIEPYNPYMGIDFGGHQTRKSWNVAWHVDFTEALLSEMDRAERKEPAPRDRTVSVVYSLRRPLPKDPIWTVRENSVRYFTPEMIKELQASRESTILENPVAH